MEYKTKKYLSHLNRAITRVEDQLEEAREQLTGTANSVHNVLTFGLAKYAENVTKFTAQLQVLYNQREAFETIFAEELELIE